jgi:tRNA 2-thiouridine synthesizing protein C
MNGSLFFTSERLTTERLSWLVELMKYYSTRIYPESLHRSPRTRTPPFSFFLLGDAGYSVLDHQHRHFWENMFKLPSFRCVFDSRELHLRGISLEPLIMRFPDQIICSLPEDDRSGFPFWNLLLDTARDSSGSPAIGFLFLTSPCPFQSSSYVLDLFRTAVGSGIAPEFYGYLDGVHAMHRDQAPVDRENIAGLFVDIHKIAAKKGLIAMNLICSQSATSRGYRTFIGENGKIVSNCINPPGKIASLNHIVTRFLKSHPILSHTSFSIEIVPQRKYPSVTTSLTRTPPSVVILATHSPYGTEYTKGAITLGVACAHQGIVTRIVFIEDGIYTLTGQHAQQGKYPPYDLQAVIQKTAHLDNLEYYVYAPSMKSRGLLVSPVLKSVCPISPSELAQIVLQPPANIEAGIQRVFVF